MKACISTDILSNMKILSFHMEPRSFQRKFMRKSVMMRIILEISAQCVQLFHVGNLKDGKEEDDCAREW